MPLNEEDIREILRLIDESEVEELRIETEALSLYVLRGDAADPDAGEDVPARAEAASPSRVDGPLTVSAPMLGTFYRAGAPGAPPFVEVGTRVGPDTVVCLIEVMKMMNAIPAGVAGTVVEVCAGNAELVEVGAPLFQIERDR
jgi:acetyl-CoA carboxylase biotin carboxyl carrier protein